MSLQVSPVVVERASSSITNWNPEKDDALKNDFIETIKNSLPEYVHLYEHKVTNISTYTREQKAVLFRGLASTSMQNAMENYFSYRAYRVGDQIVYSRECVSNEALIPPLKRGKDLLLEILKTYKHSKESIFIYDPLPGSPEEPDADTHYEFIDVVSDVRTHNYLASLGIEFMFRNCCTGFLFKGELSEAEEFKKSLFASIAAQLVAQLPERQALCC